MNFLRKNGATSNTFRFRLRSSATGQGLTGLTGASAGLNISTIADSEPAAATYTAAGATIDTIAALGTFAAPAANHCRFAEVDPVNQPGLYELQLADARFGVAGAKCLRLCISGAANLLQKDITIQLTAFDPDNATNLGLGNLDTNVGSRMATFALPANFGATLISAGGKVAATVASGDGADAATLAARLTAARAGYLDNLNVGGNVASHADIVAINQSASKHLLLATVQQFAPNETYTVEARTFAAADGSAVNADATPTLTATGNVSGNLSGNLSAATNPATGVYRWTYTPGAAPTLEQIRLDVSATIATAVFTLSAYSQTVDQATVVWTATDQSHLTSIFNKLPTNNIADETLLLAAIGTPMQAGNVTVGGYAPGQDPATLVLDVAASAHNLANSIGHDITLAAAAGAAADQWATNVPGTYTGQQAGALFARFVNSAQIVMVSPLTVLGDLIVNRKNDLDSAKGTAVSITDTAGVWPDLTGASAVITVADSSGNVQIPPTSVAITVPSGANKTVVVNLTAALLTIPATVPQFPYQYDIVATLSGGDRVTLKAGNFLVRQNVTP